MMIDYITLAGFILAVFVSGVAVGKHVEKVERLIRRKEDEENILRTGVVDSSDQLNIVIKGDNRLWVIPKSEVEYFYYSVIKREL